jgi:hypothetical protein
MIRVWHQLIQRSCCRAPRAEELHYLLYLGGFQINPDIFTIILI